VGLDKECAVSTPQNCKFRIEPTLFSADNDEDCVGIDLDGLPLQNPYLDSILEFYNGRHPPETPITTIIMEILMKRHPKGAKYCPSATISRLVDVSAYCATRPTGICGYLACNQEYHRILARKNSSTNDSIGFALATRVGNCSLSEAEGVASFNECIDRIIKAVDSHLLMAVEMKTEHSALMVALREFRQKELEGVKQWTADEAYGGKNFDGKEPKLPRELWFDGKFLPFCFSSDDHSNMTVFRTYGKNMASHSEHQYGKVMASSNFKFLNESESADAMTFLNTIIGESPSYYGYDGIHFWALDTPNFNDEILALRATFELCAQKIAERLLLIRKGKEKQINVKPVLCTNDYSLVSKVIVKEEPGITAREQSEVIVKEEPRATVKDLFSLPASIEFMKELPVMATSPDMTFALYGYLNLDNMQSPCISPEDKELHFFMGMASSNDGKVTSIGSVISVHNAEYFLVLLENSNQTITPTSTLMFMMVSADFVMTAFDENETATSADIAIILIDYIKAGHNPIILWIPRLIDLIGVRSIPIVEWLTNQVFRSSKTILKLKTTIFMLSVRLAAAFTTDRFEFSRFYTFLHSNTILVVMLGRSTASLKEGSVTALIKILMALTYQVV
jgi:hypothetical protein